VLAVHCQQYTSPNAFSAVGCKVVCAQHTTTTGVVRLGDWQVHKCIYHTKTHDPSLVWACTLHVFWLSFWRICTTSARIRHSCTRDFTNTCRRALPTIDGCTCKRHYEHASATDAMRTAPPYLQVYAYARARSLALLMTLVQALECVSDAPMQCR
jgi:hypothetical protein